MNTTIRDIDDWVIGELKQQAAASGRSLQGYLKHILGEVAKTPLPDVTRELFFDLMKEFHSTHGVEPKELHLPRYGEFWPHLKRLARDADQGSADLAAAIEQEPEDAQIGGLKIVLVDIVIGGHHGRMDSEDKRCSMSITTELMWKLAGRVDCSFRAR